MKYLETGLLLSYLVLIMYNRYELLWLWYEYHCEKADQLICSGISKYDPDMKIPVNFQQQQLSNNNAMNNRKIIEKLAGNEVQHLYEYKKTFIHLKNAALFQEYEALNEEGHFNFVHDFMINQKQKKRNGDFII